MKQISKIFGLLVIALFSLVLTGCDNVPAGYAAVKVNKYGDDRGVQNEVVGPGRYTPSTNVDYFLFPQFSISDSYARKDGKDESITFQSKEGMSINGDFGTVFSIKREDISKVFVKYRRGVDEISDIYLRNMLRDALVDGASKKSIEELMADKIKFMDDVQADVIKRAAASGITVETVSTLGEFRWPKQISDAINAKMTATQDAMKSENELRKTKADAEKKVAEAEAQVRVAEADAKAIALRGQALDRNPGVLKQQWIEKWNGALPLVSDKKDMILNLGDLKEAK